jgi:type III secretory pathway component EscU
MSLDEMRKEHRDDAGDPQIRAVRFALHQSMTFDEMVARTRRANVVVVGALEVSKGRANGISK